MTINNKIKESKIVDIYGNRVSSIVNGKMGATRIPVSQNTGTEYKVRGFLVDADESGIKFTGRFEDKKGKKVDTPITFETYKVIREIYAKDELNNQYPMRIEEPEKLKNNDNN